MNDLDEIIQNIKKKVNNETLSEEYKEELKKTLLARYNENNNKNVHNKIKSKFVFARKAIVAFACCFVVLTTGCAFGQDFDDFFKNLFSNLRPNSSQVLEEGISKKIDMEYQEYNGVKVKVSNVSMTENELYIVFDVEAVDEIEKIRLVEYEISNDDYIVSTTNVDNLNSEFVNGLMDCKINSRNSAKIISSFINENDKFEALNNLIIKINKIKIENSKEEIYVIGDWNFEINMES